jgi:hypothetical protein
MAKSNGDQPGRDANGNTDPKGWAGKHVGREGRHVKGGKNAGKDKNANKQHAPAAPEPQRQAANRPPGAVLRYTPIRHR